MEIIGTGSLVQRDKSKPRSRCRDWELSVWVKADGEKKRKTRAFHGTYTKGETALAEFVEELRGFVPTPDVTVSDWVDVWMKRREESGAYSERTLKTDREKLAALVWKLGDMRVGEVSQEDIRSLYDGARHGDTPTGRKWSPVTVRRLHTSATKLFADAVDEGLAVKSPTAGVPLPKKPPETRAAMSTSKMDEVLASLDYSKPGDRGIALALGCGLRRSECCGVMASDISDGCVSVVRTRGDDGGQKQTKTGRSRTVPLPEVVAEGLAAVDLEDGYVCDMFPHSLTYYWIRRRDSLGCSGYRFHDLRHAYATRLAASGVHMKVAMELCGWASVEMAAKVYTHVSNDMQRDAVRLAFGS